MSTTTTYICDHCNEKSEHSGFINMIDIIVQYTNKSRHRIELCEICWKKFSSIVKNFTNQEENHENDRF